MDVPAMPAVQALVRRQRSAMIVISRSSTRVSPSPQRVLQSFNCCYRRLNRMPTRSGSEREMGTMRDHQVDTEHAIGAMAHPWKQWKDGQNNGQSPRATVCAILTAPTPERGSYITSLVCLLGCGARPRWCETLNFCAESPLMRVSWIGYPRVTGRRLGDRCGRLLALDGSFLSL